MSVYRSRLALRDAGTDAVPYQTASKGQLQQMASFGVLKAVVQIGCGCRPQYASAHLTKSPRQRTLMLHASLTQHQATLLLAPTRLCLASRAKLLINEQSQLFTHQADRWYSNTTDFSIPSPNPEQQCLVWSCTAGMASFFLKQALTLVLDSPSALSNKEPP